MSLGTGSASHSYSQKHHTYNKAIVYCTFLKYYPNKGRKLCKLETTHNIVMSYGGNIIFIMIIYMHTSTLENIIT